MVEYFVSKCYFVHYAGVVRQTDQEITAIEKTACYSHFPRGGGRRHPAEARGGSTKSARRQKGRGDGMGNGLNCGFCGRRKKRQGKQA